MGRIVVFIGLLGTEKAPFVLTPPVYATKTRKMNTLLHIKLSNTPPKKRSFRKKREYSWGVKSLPPYSLMARKVIAGFGTQATFMKALRATRSTLVRSSVQRWKQRHPLGTHGRVPISSWPDVIKAANKCGITITQKELATMGGGLRYFHRRVTRRPSGKRGVKWGK